MVNKPLLRFVPNFSVFDRQSKGIAMKKSMTCFVITPYGDPNGTSDQKVLADHIHALIENIIRPVGEYCASKGFDVQMEVGFDERREAGIWKKIGERIEAAETVLAVIASNGPNTYLELGLAYGLWMRPILLQLGGWEMPSDINNLERIQVSYDQALCRNGADPRPVIAEIGDRIISIVKTGRRKPPEWFDNRTTSYGIIRTMSRFSTITDKEWSAILNEATDHIVLVMPKGRKIQGQNFYDHSGDLEDLVALLARQVILGGVDVTVITNHPNMITPEYLKRKDDSDVEEFIDSLQKSFIRWNTLRQSIDNQVRSMTDEGIEITPGKFRYIQAAGVQLPYRITLTEKRMLLTLRYTAESFNSHYCIDVSNAPSSHDDNLPLLKLIEADIARIIAMNEERSENEYLDWAATQQQQPAR
jgi:hypothetical protein